MDNVESNELLSQTQLIEAQPLAERAAGFEDLYERLLAELQKSDSQ